jgi:hypothetical protein
MHDIDQVALEDSARAPTYEQEDEEYLEFAGEGEGETAYEDELALPEGEGEGEYEDEDEEAAEAAELELATELLEVSSEQELDRFIGNLVRSAAGAVSDFTRTREGRQLGGILKQAAGRALPVLGRAAGRAIGGAIAGATEGSRRRYQRTGARIGDAVGAAAKRYFGLELEGLSPEDQEFEVARRFVQFGRDAVRECLRRLGTGPARQIAQQAVASAGQQLAPGLVTERVLDAPALQRWAATAANRALAAAPASRAPGAASRAPAARAAVPAKRAPAAAAGNGASAGSQAAARPAPVGACPDCGAGLLATRGGRWERRGNAIVLFTN